MKKTLLALTVASLATTANAYTLYDNAESGTKIDFGGSLRLKWESHSTKNTNSNGVTTRNHRNDAVDNNGSRFGFKINQQIGNGFYAVGGMQFRFQDSHNHQHNFGRLYTREAYAGIGHKQYGELTYGNMTLITDEVKRTDLPNTNSLSDGLLEYAGRKVAQYTYKGIEGLKAGVYYGGKSDRNLNGSKSGNERKYIWGLAAIYKYNIDELQHVKVGVGYSDLRFDSSANNTKQRQTYAFDTSYTFDKTTFGVDLERRVTDYFNGNQRKENEVRTVLLQELSSVWNVYGMYAYRHNVLDRVASNEVKTINHEFMVGTEYVVFKQDSFKVKPFVEWKAVRAKTTDAAAHSKSRDYATVVGLRAYW